MKKTCLFFGLLLVLAGLKAQDSESVLNSTRKIADKIIRETSFDFTPAIMREIRGSWLYLVKIVPGTVGATFEFDVWDKNDDLLLDTTGNSNSATTWIMGHDTLGLIPPVIHELSVEIDGADAMTSTNTLDIYMYFTK